MNQTGEVLPFGSRQVLLLFKSSLQLVDLQQNIYYAF